MGNRQLQKLKTFSKFAVTGKDDTYKILINKFIEDTKDIVVDTLLSKGMEDEEAIQFADDMFVMFPKMKDKVVDLCKNRKVPSDAAKMVMDKYYKIAVVNYQGEKGHEEISDVNEKVDNKVNNKAIFFWYFIKKMKDIGVKFKLDTVQIKQKANSLNNDNGNIKLKTVMIDDITLKRYFDDSQSLGILTDSPETFFFIDIDPKGYILFGKGDEVLGKILYKSNDIAKLEDVIDTNIDIKKLSFKFKDTFKKLSFVKNKLVYHLLNNEDTYVYMDIVDNKLTVKVDCEDDGTLNAHYINTISGWASKYIDVKVMKRKEKTIYYLTIK